jgi:hypothetical protein
MTDLMQCEFDSPVEGAQLERDQLLDVVLVDHGIVA